MIPTHWKKIKKEEEIITCMNRKYIIILEMKKKQRG